MIEQIVEDRKLLGCGNNADKRALVEVNIWKPWSFATNLTLVH